MLIVSRVEASETILSEAPDDRPSALRRELNARFRLPLIAFFTRRVGNRSEAEDLTQETFLRLIGSREFDRTDQANAFVFRVASNLLTDHNRRTARVGKRKFVPLDKALFAELAAGIVEDRGPERVLLAKEGVAEVITCLNELDERVRNVFILFRLEGMKHKDIAALYGISVSTVEKHIMKAGLHLTTRLGPRTG